MAPKRSAYRGCLLGLAVGDAMGCTVDSHSLKEIQEDYGINGLQEYTPANGYAVISSYTQLAAFACNGLLLGLTRGQTQGKMAPFVNYIGLSHREWAAAQRPWGQAQQPLCWLLGERELCRRNCMDLKMLDTLERRVLGNPEMPRNASSQPGGLTSAVAAGLFFHQDRMEAEEIGQLGAEAVALTHGNPVAFLAGAYTAMLTAYLLWAPGGDMKQLVLDTAEAFREQFGGRYSQAKSLYTLLRHVVKLADSPAWIPVDVMEKLHCETAAQALAGAVYACLVGGGDFDRTMYTAVNHSGRSAAVASLAGAFLGARYGEAVLPTYYIECLETAETLRELGDDLFSGCPLEKGSRLFDLDWDRKYIHGGR